MKSLRSVILVASCVIGSTSAAPRETTSLDFDWRFHRGDLTGVLYHNNSPASASSVFSPFNPGFDDSSWEKVNVPHDYVFQGPLDHKANVDAGSFRVEPGWYRKTIDIPAAGRGRRLWLEFDGAYRDSKVWLNGSFLGRHESGYTSFHYDITQAAKPGGTNLLVVRVDPTRFEGWWYEGGGIYRHVRLVSLSPVHFAPWGVHVNPGIAESDDGVQADAQLKITTAIQDESASAARVELLSEILNAEGVAIASQRTQRRLGTPDPTEWKQTIALPKANLWCCERPYLYQLRSSLALNGQVADQVTTCFGVRAIRFDANQGFLLNGQRVKIKGTCNHQDFAGVGIALPDAIHEFRVRKLQEMGANAYRSHHMTATELLDVCDRLGMLVMAENRHLGDSAEILGQLESLIRRDRNHPSVVIWSIANEEKEQGSELGARQGRVMKKLIRQLDPTRPITAAMNNGYGAGLTGVIDVQGINYHPQDYDWMHARFPRMPLVATEIAAAVGARGVYERKPFSKGGAQLEGDPERCHVSAYGVNALDWSQLAEEAWKAIADRHWMSGAFVWSGFDYRGEPTPFEWPALGTQYAIIDQCGFPKDVFYYYQSWWTDKPVLHLFPHWNWPGREGREIAVWVYSNCESVELFLNHQSLGAQTMPRNGHLEWKVKYAPGKLTASGRRNGATITTEVQTTGAPAAVKLEPNRTTIAPGGNDVSLVTVKIVDAQSRVVPTASNLVEFSVTGAGHLLGVGNGDPACHESDKAYQRSAFNGLCLSIIQAGLTNGAITLKADSAGLKPAAVSFEVR